MLELNINGKTVKIDASPKMPLLWVLRDRLGMTGTKFGCGAAQCGACTVHIDGEAARSCVTQAGSAQGKTITTIEGLAAHSPVGKRLQRAWVDEQVPQCGYCQSGQLMAAAVLLRKRPQPSDAEINQAMAGNICRCGTYSRIRKAIHRAAKGGSQ